MKKIAGRPVTCDVKNKDMYGRSVSVCYVGGSVAGGGTREDLNAWLVSQGDAVAYEQYSKAYVPLEQQAKAERKVRGGLALPRRRTHQCPSSAPWELPLEPAVHKRP